MTSNDGREEKGWEGEGWEGEGKGGKGRGGKGRGGEGRGGKGWDGVEYLRALRETNIWRRSVDGSFRCTVNSQMQYIICSPS